MIDKTSPVFLAVCKRFGVDPKLVAAIITAESTWNEYAARYEPAWAYKKDPQKFAEIHQITPMTELVLQKISWGPMQVMGTVARELGYRDMLTKLTDPASGLQYGVRYLLSKLERYNGNVEDAIAAYNAGSAKKDPLTGKYENQVYVNKVLNAF